MPDDIGDWAYIRAADGQMVHVLGVLLFSRLNLVRRVWNITSLPSINHPGEAAFSTR